MAVHPSSTHTRTALLDITNKTPFTKSQIPVTPGLTSLKFPKSFTVFNDKATTTRRISSTRKKLRLPKSVGKNFETPETRGNYWDVSDVSIDVSGEEVSETEEDFDDLEYTPPSAIEQKYEPPFEMPDYNEVGAALMSLFGRYKISEDSHPVTEFDNTGLLAELESLECERLELPELPLENIFPFMISSQIPLSSTTHHRPQGRYVRPGTGETSNFKLHRQVTSSLTPENPTRLPREAGLQRPTNHVKPIPINLTSKPPNRMTSHAHVPSWSVHTSPAVRITQPTRSHSRSTSVPHPKAISALQSRTAIAPKLSLSKRSVQTNLDQVSEDTVLSLVAAENEVIGEEFLFDV